MLHQKMKSLTAGSLGVAGLVLVIIAIICFLPMVFLWSINSLAELGGSSFYIEHSPFSYLVAFVVVAIVRGGKN